MSNSFRFYDVAYCSPSPTNISCGGLPTIPPAPSPSLAKQAQKDQNPNSLPQEIVALIATKREMFLQELDTIDSRDLMTP